MAADIGVKIDIDGYQKFKTEIQDITQSQKTLKSEMAAVSSAWDKNTKAEEKNAEKKRILNQQISEQEQKVKKLQDVVDKTSQKYGENSREVNSWKEKLNSATAELNKMQNELKEIPNGLQNFGSKMQEAGGHLKDFGQAFAPISAVAAAGIGASVKLAADFEGQMSKVGAISGASADDLLTLSDKAREMGATTKFSATEAGKAMEYMAMAGWKTEDMVSGVGGIMNLAAASGEDLATVSDIVTDALTAMGLSAEDSGHFADVLAAASSNANTNVSLMGETFKYAAPLAGALGFDIEDLAVATGLMANAGIKGSQSGTALRGWLTRLAKPTAESGKAMEELGLSITDSEGNMKSLSQIIEETRGAFQNLTEDEKAQYAAMLAGQNGMSGLLAVVNASEEDFNKLSEAVGNANGTAENMANTMQDNLNGQLTVLKSGLEEAAISIGNALLPAIKGMADAVQGAVTWFNSLDEETKSVIAVIGVVVAAIAPVAIVLGSVISAIGVISTAIGAAIPVITGAAAAFGGVVVAVGPVIAIFAAVMAAGVLLYQNWDLIKAKAAELAQAVSQKWEEIKTNVGTAIENVKTTVSEGIETAKTTVENTLENIKQAFSEKFESAKKIVSDAVDFLKGVFNFEWKLPELKLPHFKVQGEFSLNPPRVPRFDIEWYSKAMQNGMILTSPTIFGASGNTLLGAGEAGAEVVVGAGSLSRMIQNAVNNTYNNGGNTINVYGAAGQDVHELAEAIADIINADVRSKGAVWA